MTGILVLACALVLSTCTRKNPDAVFDLDGAAADQGQVADGQVQPRDDAGETGDGQPSRDQRVPGPDAFSCPPNAPLKCENQHELIKCNAEGTALVTVDCSPYQCVPQTLRCSQCNPSMQPKCDEDAVVSCTSDGLLVIQACPDGCQGGKCLTCTPHTYYKDDDDDGFGDPDVTTEACEPPDGYVNNSDDCDDDDANAFPGQTQFFTTPTDGTGDYDYNCNGVEQKQYFLQGNCVWLPMVGCVGDGWDGGVPDCGDGGTFVECVPHPGQSQTCDEKSSQRVQPCR